MVAGASDVALEAEVSQTESKIERVLLYKNITGRPFLYTDREICFLEGPLQKLEPCNTLRVRCVLCGRFH